MNALVGIDIGGTNTKIGIIRHGDHYEVLKPTSSIETRPGDGFDVYIQRVADAVRSLVRKVGGPTILGAGVGCPGIIDPTTGLVRKSPNLPFLQGIKLKERLEPVLGMEVEVQNDANAAALGEYLFGASKDVRNMCLLTLGTGVGGGVICDGKLLIGADNAATELGHLKLEWNGGPLCGCGRTGCLEAYVGAAGIVRIARELLAGKSPLADGEFTPKDVVDAAAGGDVLAKEALRRVGEYLGRGICLLIETLNPEKIVIGGGASGAMPFLQPGIDLAVMQHASFPFTRDRVKIERSALPDDINVVGAAAIYLAAHPQAK